MLARLGPAGAGYDAQQLRDSAAGLEIAPEPVNTYRAEIEEFSQALLDGRQSCLSGQIGLRSQMVLAACYESARAGRAMSV
jgi:predicted dehydrogenase